MDLISIIIPYFKKKEFIKQTLKSAINQTYKNIEILIVFDGGSEKDLKFLKNLISKQPKIKMIINKKNLGAGMCRNLAIRKSKGKYIAFLDADDLWKKNKILMQLKFMKKKNIKVSHTSFNIINEKGNFKKKILARNLNFNQLLKSCDICLSTVMIKKELLEKKVFKFANLRTKEDYVLWLNLAKNNYIFYSLNKYLTSWRNVENSLSSNTFQKLVDGFKVYRYYLNFTIFKSLYRLLILSLYYLWKKYF